MKRKVYAVLLALIMVLSLLPFSFTRTTETAEATTYPSAIDRDLVQETVQGGAILHCFNWSYNAIKAALPDIYAAGYTAVQTSPVQQPKDYRSDWISSGDNWWKLYQPLGMRIAPTVNDEATSWLGTKDELTALCTEADHYGIKVIVDIVSNHLANKASGGIGTNLSNLCDDVDNEWKNQEFFHTYNDFINDNSRFNITQFHMGMPDLNTQNSTVQTRVLNLLKECVDCGVDGFRFDAAKHIELPTDDGCGNSQFWPTIINGIKTYCTNKGMPEPFLYGEILGGAGTDIGNYTQYMAVTDNETGNAARSNVVWHNAAGLANFYYYKGASADKCVLWAESHDTYMDHSSDGVSNEDIIKTWAIVGARADSTSLYLARPGEYTMGAAGDETWKNSIVSEINKFKNHFNGTTEYISSNGDVTYIERGVNGAVLVNLGSNTNISVPANKLKKGTYTDRISGNTFTVNDAGTISGVMGSSGVAVLYDPAAAAENYTYLSLQTIYLQPNANWLEANAWFAVYFYNEPANTNQMVKMTAVGDGCYQATVPAGDWTNVIFVRMDGGKTAVDWSSKWNQTVNLTVPSGKDCFTIESGSGDSYNGSWSKYMPAGYYLVGNMTGWQLEPEYLMSVNPGNPGEYMLTDVNLTTFSQFKVVKSQGGVLTWYPASGTNYNESGTEIAANGKYTVYFNPNGGQSGWHDGYIDTQKTANESPNAGYYIVGTMNNWTVDATYKLTLNNGASTTEYSIDLGLLKTDMFKVVYSADGTEKTMWFPAQGDNYGQYGEITADGVYHTYFRPGLNGDSGWFYGCIYVDQNPVSSYYVVTLLPGSGEGDPVTIRSEGNWANDMYAAANGKFWKEDNEVWFKFPECPPTFSMAGHTFGGWSDGGVACFNPGVVQKITGNLTLTAVYKWNITYAPIDAGIAAWGTNNIEALHNQTIVAEIRFADGAKDAGWRLNKVVLSWPGGDNIILENSDDIPLNKDDAIKNLGGGVEGYQIRFYAPDSDFTVTAVWDAYKPIFVSQSMIVTGEIGVAFNLRTPNVGTFMPGDYMTFEIKHNGNLAGKQPEKVYYKDATQLDDNKWQFVAKINSIQMAEEIIATVHYGENQAKTVSTTFRPQDYFTSYFLLTGRPDAEKCFVKAFKNYGYYVQLFLQDVNPWTFGNGGWTSETDKQYIQMSAPYGKDDTIGFTPTSAANDTDAGALRDALESYKFDKDDAVKNIMDVTYSLTLDSVTSINVDFSAKSGYTGTPTFTVKDSDNKIVTKATVSGSGPWTVKIPNICAQDLDKMYTITVKEGDTTVGTVQVSGLSYVRGMLSASLADPFEQQGSRVNWRNAAAAIYTYWYYAHALKYPVNP